MSSDEPGFSVAESAGSDPVTPEEIAHALGMPAPTEEQAAVIAAPAEPALVIAGAGAGKTETMAARVVWLVANGLVTPERVLGLTFTRKAARQLADRVRGRLRRLAGSGLFDRADPSGQRRRAVLVGEPTVLTYHAYAGRLLGEHGLRLPIQPRSRVLSQTEAWQLAHRVVTTWDQDLDTDRVPASVTAQLLALSGELAEHLVDHERLQEYTSWFCGLVENAPRAPRQREALPAALTNILASQRFRISLLPLIERYQQRKRTEGALDFADQMSLAARLAARHPEVRQAERHRYGAVLLDEYQDTGHAQRVLLRALFGDADSMPVTAVGDPAQAIYGWRGASAANLPRFSTDFPRQEGDHPRPAHEYGMLTSFRNPPEVLTAANAIAEPLRHRGLAVQRLRARPDSATGGVLCALLPDVHTERTWIAEELAREWFSRRATTGAPPTAAVLVRRRADMAPVAAVLRAHDLPVEVVGLGGLLDEPEVADLVSTLRVLAEPLSGSAAARLLTGARWRLAAADLAALWRRARELSTGDDSVVDDHVEQAGLIDAVDDPGERSQYSAEGYARIRRVGRELAALRRRLDQPLPELVADVERTMLLDVEALARPGTAGRVHLDAFADVVTEYAENAPAATLVSFLDYLDTAAHAEDGLTPGEVEVSTDRVQVLTVHSAKGLEWQIVAVPHLVHGTFPGRRQSSSWLKTVSELPATLRGDAADLPDLALHHGADRKEVMQTCDEHEELFAERHAEEERRLCYVAVTRSEHRLLMSGHRWNATGSRPQEPSAFLTEIAAAMAEDEGIGRVVQWEPEPEPEARNPLAEATHSMVWPPDPLGDRREAVREGAELVREQIDQLAHRDHREDPDRSAPAMADEDPDGWVADTDILLAERHRAQEQHDQVVLPNRLSVTQLVDLATDSESLARSVRRPLPMPPNTSARRGTAFHTWLERRFAGERLLELGDLPGAADTDADNDTDLDALQKAFERSVWAERTPHEVEVPFSTDIDGVLVQGRMDAVFADSDGGWTVVDWKTGRLPDDTTLRSLSVQLAIYRLAWSELSGAALEKVRAAFHYVSADRTLHPVDLLDAKGLRQLLADLPQQEQRA